MAGPGDPEDADTPYFYEYANYPIWTGGDNYTSLSTPGFIPPDENINTFRRTKYITDMVASNQGEGTINPKGVNFDNNLSNPWAGGIRGGEGHSSGYDPNENPPGGWVIDPQEHIPCRGYNAVTCSLTARARQMWQMQFQDQGIGGDDGGWLPGWGPGLAEADIMGGLDTVKVGPSGDLFGLPVYLTHTFGNVNVGPFKMSDFYGLGHWSVDIIVYEQEIIWANAPAIQITNLYFLGDPLYGGYGLRMKGSGQLHLGGNPNNPAGQAGSTELAEGTTLVGENVNVSYPDWGVNVPAGNVTSTPVNINTNMTELNSTDALVGRHFSQVSDNIINLTSPIATTAQ